VRVGAGVEVAGAGVGVLLSPPHALRSRAQMSVNKIMERRLRVNMMNLLCYMRLLAYKVVIHYLK
jgi:hypothetical protein